MTDQDIREYIDGLEQPLFLRDVVSELTSKDPLMKQIQKIRGFSRIAKLYSVTQIL